MRRLQKVSSIPILMALMLAQGHGIPNARVPHDEALIEISETILSGLDSLDSDTNSSKEV